jgi:MscS family membrane protein
MRWEQWSILGFVPRLFRQFDTTSISLPNYVFSDSAILNYSHRKYRRIKWTIGLTYDTSTENLKLICHQIEDHIKNNKILLSMMNINFLFVSKNLMTQVLIY